MEKKNSKLLILVAVLLIIGVGISFSYFLVGVSFNGEGSTANISTGKMPEVIYDAGDTSLSSDSFVPGSVIRKTFKVTVTPTTDIKEVTYRIFMNITNNTFVKCTEENHNDFSNDCELNREELVYRLKNSSGTVIKSGNLIGQSGSIELARETKTQDARTEYNYTIEIEFINTNKDQNHNQNAIFNGDINVEFAEQIIQ